MKSCTPIGLIILICGALVSARVDACSCTGGYKYCNGGRWISNLTGVQADIECRNVTLCNEVDADPATHSVACCAVGFESPSGDVTAEIGWLKANHFWDQPYVRRRKYYWICGPGGDQYDWAADPGNNTYVNYKAVLTDVANGTWTFYFNGLEWLSDSHDDWKGNKGTFVGWQGEIYRQETDMPGTSTDKCAFQDCKYKVDDTWSEAGLSDANMHSSDLNEWGWQRENGTLFYIWDKDPL